MPDRHSVSCCEVQARPPVLYPWPGPQSRLLSLALPPVGRPRRTLHRREILALKSGQELFSSLDCRARRQCTVIPSPAHHLENFVCVVFWEVLAAQHHFRVARYAVNRHATSDVSICSAYCLAGYLSRRHCRRMDTGEEPNEALEHNGPCPVRFLRLECSDVLFLRSWF